MGKGIRGLIILRKAQPRDGRYIQQMEIMVFHVSEERLRYGKLIAESRLPTEQPATQLHSDAGERLESPVLRCGPRLLGVLVVVGFGFQALGEETAVFRDSREDWDTARVRTELGQLDVEAETECSRSTIADGWEDTEPDIASLHGGLFSPYDGLCFPNFHYVDIEHIVARKEADESGMCDLPTSEREAFAIDLLNLTFAPGSLNGSKGALDAGDLEAAEQSLFRDELTWAGKCFWAAQTVRVKSKYGLGVDTDEKDALDGILADCESEGTLTTRPEAPAGCGWTVRSEFAAAVADTANAPDSSCSELPGTESWQAALQYADEIVCITGFPASLEESEDDAVATNPRASQIAAQEACKQELESISCTAIEEQCPSVGVIHRGEPLYQAKGTNGRSNDSDDDGLFCEEL